MRPNGRVLATALIFALYSIPGGAFAARSIALTVDATDSPGHLLHGREIINVQPGPLTLFYPKWIPGEHSPTGPILDLVGLNIVSKGTPIRWRRDLVEMYAIHCTVPKGTTSIDVSYDFILPPAGRGFSSAGSSTPVLLVLNWNQVVLYPENDRPADITMDATLKIPEGWKFATALDVARQNDNEIVFKAVPLSQLIDSPVLTGKYFRRIDITGDLPVPHAIDMASDDPAALEMPAWLIDEYKQLALQENLLFGSHHYSHYDFLYTLSNQVAHFGLEHHQSSDDRVDEYTLLDYDLNLAHAALLPHEMVHSWNGKYRRPAGLATGNYSTPMQDDLLWVYEGLTEYLGDVLTARSGLRTPEQYRENLALVAAGLDHRPGREWRPLQDADDEAPLLYSSREDWSSYRRGVDFYDEGELIWLEADVTIRTITGGKKSLDDFCRLFYGPPSTGPEMKPYSFDDVVTSLNTIAPYDWRAFFTERLESLSPRAPLGGIEKGGWKLAYADTLTEIQEARENAGKDVDMRFSLGFDVDDDGILRDVIPGSPASLAGLIPSMRLVSINGRKYNAGTLRDLVKASGNDKGPIELMAIQGTFYSTHQINYHGGAKYPCLKRDSATSDILTQILQPLTKK